MYVCLCGEPAVLALGALSASSVLLKLPQPLLCGSGLRLRLRRCWEVQSGAEPRCLLLRRPPSRMCFVLLFGAQARQVLANSEWRKRKLSQRIASEEKRLEEETAEEREEMKRKRENEAVWEKTREQRVGSWHDFAKKQKDKGKMSVGGIKPPQLKTSDADKLYVQRPAGEHFRPPPPKNQQPPPRR